MLQQVYVSNNIHNEMLLFSQIYLLKTHCANKKLCTLWFDFVISNNYCFNQMLFQIWCILVLNGHKFFYKRQLCKPFTSVGHPWCFPFHIRLYIPTPFYLILKPYCPNGGFKIVDPLAQRELNYGYCWEIHLYEHK